jgi:DNA-directed RNA polymerase specialized sigma24 family protein
VRAWLYRIATNRRLDALRARSRRPREVQAMNEPPEPTRRTEPIWLEPYPDVLLDDLPDRSPGPAARYEAREWRASACLALVHAERVASSTATPASTREEEGFGGPRHAACLQGGAFPAGSS